MAIHFINSADEIEKVICSIDKFYAYGAGYFFRLFLKEIVIAMDSIDKLRAVIVTSGAQGQEVEGIPLKNLDQVKMMAGDVVFLTMGDYYADEVVPLLANSGIEIYRIENNVFEERPYLKVKASIQPFIDAWPNLCKNCNNPVESDKVYAWSMWWQGEDSAPDIVKACWHSQRVNLPNGVVHIIITEKNYHEYMDLPDIIIEKLNDGFISMATLSDIIRGTLLYKYGGFWLDSTILIHGPVKADILDMPLWTRNIPRVHYGANAMWAGFFWFSKKGDVLFKFLSEAFYYYFEKYDRILYYLQVDYIVAIASNLFPEVEQKLNAIPYSNEHVFELAYHLKDKYDSVLFANLIRDGFFKKLTYKIDWNNQDEYEGSVFNHIIKCYTAERSAIDE